ncbi:MAG: nucleoside phosphorylase [Thermodesulfobacteriota bacterium]
MINKFDTLKLSGEAELPPILGKKSFDKPSLFTPRNLLHQARRQRGLQAGNIPAFCVLDPDGDLFRYLRSCGGRKNPFWACYHTELYEMEVDKTPVGVVGCAVGASFAVLVAEQLFASGCLFLMSVTSAGQILPAGSPPYFVLIDRALRDEGTSYHYLPPSPYSRIHEDLLSMIQTGMPDSIPLMEGSTWTTDAPFRETEKALAFARSEGLTAVEMEAAALYAFAQAQNKPVICFAHVTNQMGLVDKDFEKGEENGNKSFTELISAVIKICKARGKYIM